VDFLDRILGRARNVGLPASGDPERVRVVQGVIDELAPLVAADGGSIELVEVGDDGWVSVRMRGACSHCDASSDTLRLALEPRLRAVAPWLCGVRAVV
jgi:Fe-S cluster biogenesis protein NfuA